MLHVSVQGDAVELTEYVKANMDKLRGMYEQQVSAAADMIAHQTEKSGVDPLSNKVRTEQAHWVYPRFSDSAVVFLH